MHYKISKSFVRQSKNAKPERSANEYETYTNDNDRER